MNEDTFSLLIKRIESIEAKNQFASLAKEWGTTPVDRDTFQSAIAFANISLGRRCEFYRWFEDCWRSK